MNATCQASSLSIICPCRAFGSVKVARAVAPGATSRREVLNATALASTTLLLEAASGPHAQAAYVEEDVAEWVFQSVAPSVVAIEDYKTVNGSTVQEGVGSGFVWDNYGHIVTNYHCISNLARDKNGTESTKVTFYGDDGYSRSYSASIAGVDPSRDLAVLSIDADADVLAPIPIGSSAGLLIGQFVFAIGNPAGLSRTQTCGVVSGLNRGIPSPTGIRIPGAIQTDAPINAGNSGGPLLDSSGRIIGINTATFSKQGSGRGSGVNFALPIDMVRTVVPKLIVYGQASERRI